MSLLLATGCLDAGPAPPAQRVAPLSEGVQVSLETALTGAEDDVGYADVGRISNAVSGSELAPVTFHCTGTLIGPHTVLTAAHCVQRLDPDEPSIYTFELCATDGCTTYEVDAIAVAPPSESAIEPYGNDVALARLVGAPPVEARPLCSEGTYEGEVLRMVGHGIYNDQTGDKEVHDAEALQVTSASLVVRQVDDGSLCARDSGAPLMSKDKSDPERRGCIRALISGPAPEAQLPCIDTHAMAPRTDREACASRAPEADEVADVDAGEPCSELENRFSMYRWIDCMSARFEGDDLDADAPCEPGEQVDYVSGAYVEVGRVYAERLGAVHPAAFQCTGTLVGSRTVLTARHCLAAAADAADPASLAFQVCAGDACEIYGASAVAIPPAADDGSPFTNDFGLFRLERAPVWPAGSRREGYPVRPRRLCATSFGVEGGEGVVVGHGVANDLLGDRVVTAAHADPWQDSHLLLDPDGGEICFRDSGAPFLAMESRPPWRGFTECIHATVSGAADPLKQCQDLTAAPRTDRDASLPATAPSSDVQLPLEGPEGCPGGDFSSYHWIRCMTERLEADEFPGEPCVCGEIVER